MGQFEAKHDPLLLLGVIAEVLREADADRPDAVSQRAYNAARADAGYGDTPRADKLCKRFGVSWLVLRDRVVHAKDPAHALSMASKTQARRVLTQAEISSALRRAARFLGTDTVTAASYEQARRAINGAAARRHTHGSTLVPMPAANTIRKRVDFAAAVRAAGLSAPSSNARPTLPRADAVALFVEHYGFAPHKADLSWFGRHHRIRIVDHSNEPQSQAVAAAADRFAHHGRWFPPNASRHARPEDWREYDHGAAALAEVAKRYPRERTQGEGFTLEEVRAAISTAYDLAGNERLTAVRYQNIAAEHRLPSIKTVIAAAKRNGTSFSALVSDETASRLRKRKAA